MSRLLALYPLQHRPPAHQVVRAHLYYHHHDHIIFTIGVSHLTGRPLHLTETQAQGVGGAQSQRRPVHRAPGETGVHWATSGARPDNNKNIYYKNNVVDIAITSACPAAPLSPWCWSAGPWWRSAGPGRARTCRTGYWTHWARSTLKWKRVLGSFHTLGVRIEREMNACPDRQTDIGTPCASIGAKKIWEFWKRSSEAFYICLCWSQTNCPQTGPGDKSNRNILISSDAGKWVQANSSDHRILNLIFSDEEHLNAVTWARPIWRVKLSHGENCLSTWKYQNIHAGDFETRYHGADHNQSSDKYAWNMKTLEIVSMCCCLLCGNNPPSLSQGTQMWVSE